MKKKKQNRSERAGLMIRKVTETQCQPVAFRSVEPFFGSLRFFLLFSLFFPFLLLLLLLQLHVTSDMIEIHKRNVSLCRVPVDDSKVRLSRFIARQLLNNAGRAN